MLRVKKFVVVLAMALLSVGLWTVGPLFGLWAGSKVQGAGPPSMAAILTVVGVLGVTTLVLARLLSWLNAVDDQLSGRKAETRRPYPWLESVRGERKAYVGEEIQLSSLERILVVVVVIAFVIFQIWFFFLAGAPFGSA